MKREDLVKQHPYHKIFSDKWQLYDLIRESGDALIEHALYRQPRESEENYRARLRDGVVFNIGKTIVEIYSFYLNEKETVYVFPGMEDDEQFKMYIDDADLQGNDYKSIIVEGQKLASYFGSIGVLINKPHSPDVTLAPEIENGIYPYLTLYTPENIFDWEWTKNEITHRKVLSMLKLYEGNDTWTFWYPNSWERWQLTKTNKMPKRIDDGENPLGEIPFVWMKNLPDYKYPEIGMSDLLDIARIVISITQNISSGDEIIKYAGFPIMRVPMQREDTNPDASDPMVETGPTAVSQFDPSLGEAAKSDWMPTEILEPIQAIYDVINRKEDEIYRIAYLSGIHSQRRSKNVQTSGLALRYEFSQLNSVLLQKAKFRAEAELFIHYYWLKWMKKESLYKNVEVRPSKDFSIDELAVELDNAIESYGAVLSKRYRERIQSKIAYTVLPDLSQDDKKVIEFEIGKNTPSAATFDSKITNRALVKTTPGKMADHSKDTEGKET